jgi:putative ABC transport system substrate-binding protein
MNQEPVIRLLSFQLDNPKSAIQKRPRRPKLVAALALAFTFVVGVTMAQAQQPGSVYRIGILQSASSEEAFIEGFRQGLRKLGYVEGKNLVLEARSGDMQPDRIANSVAEFVRLKVDIIVAGGAPAVVAAKKASGTIPIVMRVGTDPVKSGLVASLAHPDGNITGVASINDGLIGKRFDLLTEAVPGAKRIAVLTSRSNRAKFMATEEYKEMEAAARAVGAKLQVVLATTPTAIDNAFMAMTNERSQALIVIPTPSYLQQRERILKLAIKNRMPAIYPHSLFVEDGGLMSYGADFIDEYRRLAIFVDKILKGAKPADLPVEQPMKFEFVVNLKTAKVMGLTVPPNLLVRATRVIR